MKIKILLIANLYFLFSSCSNSHTISLRNWKTINLKAFSIAVPAKWTYKPQQGEDSFVGIIITTNSNLNFDCSNMGYANGLLLSENEYLAMQQYSLRYHPDDLLSNDDGNITSLYEGQFLGRSLTNQIPNFKESDDTLVTIVKPNANEIKILPKAEYIAKVSVKRQIKYIPIKLPAIVKNHTVIVDTVGKYIRKLIRPKGTGKGLTGVYIQKLNSTFNFEMSGRNLSAKDQADALQAFKTIKFKE